MWIGAIKNRHVSPLATTSAQSLHSARHKGSLIAFVVGVESHNRIARSGFGPEFFGFTSKVLCDHRVSSIKNILCAAIVLFEKDNAHFIKSIFELSDIAEVGPAECVDRLIGVTDNTHVLVASREAQNYLVLRNVRVLVFVNHDVLESILVRSQHVGMHAEQTHDINQEVIKIHGSGFE